jgi:hypothetical protein
LTGVTLAGDGCELARDAVFVVRVDGGGVFTLEMADAPTRSLGVFDFFAATGVARVVDAPRVVVFRGVVVCFLDAVPLFFFGAAFVVTALRAAAPVRVDAALRGFAAALVLAPPRVFFALDFARLDTTDRDADVDFVVLRRVCLLRATGLMLNLQKAARNARVWNHDV